MRLWGHGKGDLALDPAEGSGWGRWPPPHDCVRRDPYVGKMVSVGGLDGPSRAGGNGSLWKEEMRQGFWGEAGFLGRTVCQA